MEAADEDWQAGQAVKQYEKRRVVGVIRRAALGNTGGGNVINTAYIERLNATLRSRLVGLVRRTRSLARRQELFEAGGSGLVGASYNCCTAHHSLRVEPSGGHEGVERTPAMAAGLTDHIWSIAELLSYQVPLPEWVAPKRRGRPPKQSRQSLESLAA